MIQHTSTTLVFYAIEWVSIDSLDAIFFGILLLWSGRWNFRFFIFSLKNGFDSCSFFLQVIGSITAVSSSLLVGKAGPMVHIGACVGSLLGQVGSKKYGLIWKWLHFFKNDRDRRDLITCGAAAGMAAAFRAPVGGVLFAFEEMASWCVLLIWYSLLFL